MVTIQPKPAFFPLKSIVFSIFFVAIFAANGYAADGKAIFKANCASCHRLNDQKLTGPGLAGVAGRVPSDDWMKKWIENPAAMIKSGDVYANKIYNDYDKSSMTAFGGILSSEEIDAVIAYIKNPGPIEGPVAPTGPVTTTGGVPVEKGPNVFLLLTIVGGLMLLVFALKSAKRNLQNTVNAREGKDPVPEYSWREWMTHNKRSVALIIIVVVCMGSKWSWDAMFKIGVYQGYKPSQPIKFSHKIHAGDNAINCEYCHSGVSKSRVAGVPSVSVCMNCHKAISTGPITGETEIAKIYAAAGWNTKTGKYDLPPQPVRWNKVHVLPDFVFFSHQQHVVVGKQECITCHGDVAKMDVASQEQPLTMGWCINCHRTTAVPGMTDNPYYEDLHKKLAEKYKGQPITVDKMGGIECAKCHY